MAAAKKSVQIPMHKAKETKGTWMYVADDDTMPITNLYIQKAGLDKFNSAEEITVTVAES